MWTANQSAPSAIKAPSKRPYTNQVIGGFIGGPEVIDRLLHSIIKHLEITRSQAKHGLGQLPKKPVRLALLIGHAIPIADPRTPNFFMALVPDLRFYDDLSRRLIRSSCRWRRRTLCRGGERKYYQ
jgi:hypothetical protein